MSAPAIRDDGTKRLWDDRATGAYLVTCADGYCFEQPDDAGENGLHELVSNYVDGSKREALRLARQDFRTHAAQRCEAAMRGNCEWCHRP